MTAQPLPPFLTAEWRYLAMLNFEISPDVLCPLVPAGTELDQWEGRTLISVVGFLFMDTRVRGIAIPGHRNFEEVNLRFYVRHRAADGWRRGVVFVKELVPRRAIAWTARLLYGENYVAVPMGHRMDSQPSGQPGQVTYWWRHLGVESRIDLSVAGDPQPVTPDSEEEFITEHYWGYTQGRGGRTREYQVAHPRWRVWNAVSARLTCDTGKLYGPAFVDALQAQPSSAFLADGSEITVYQGRLLPS